jgi:hypothetical protein
VRELWLCTHNPYGIRLYFYHPFHKNFIANQYEASIILKLLGRRRRTSPFDTGFRSVIILVFGLPGDGDLTGSGTHSVLSGRIGACIIRTTTGTTAPDATYIIVSAAAAIKSTATTAST